METQFVFSGKEAIVIFGLPSIKLGVNHLPRALTPCLHLHPCLKQEPIKGNFVASLFQGLRFFFSSAREVINKPTFGDMRTLTIGHDCYC